MFKEHFKAIRESFWFLPLVYNLIALALAVAAVMVDYSLTRETSILGVAPITVARTTEILSALAGAILTMTTITFSGILVVLTTYSSQFSPRVLQNFIGNRSTQHVLALFSSGFTYCVLALLIVSEEEAYHLLATPAGAIFWSLAAIAAFIFLLNHTTSWLRVNNLIAFIAGETSQTIRELKEQRLHKSSRALNESNRYWVQPGTTLTAPASGYVVLIETDKLLQKAVDDGVVIRLEIGIGNFVVEGMPVITIIGEPRDKLDPKAYSSLIRTGIEPRSWQDVGFGLRKIAEIGLRAISPSINDPYTAETSVHYMARLLVELSRASPVNSGFIDSEGELRLLVRQPGFEQYLLRAFQELRRYGAQDNTTLASILNALAWIARLGHERWHDLLWEFGADTYRLGCRSSNLLGAELQRLQVAVRQLAAAVSRDADACKLIEEHTGGPGRSPG